MKGTKWNKFVIVLLIAGVFTFVGCNRYHDRHSAGHKTDRVVGYVSDKLDLTDAQKVEFEKTATSMLQSRQEMHNDGSLREAVVKELSKERIDTVRLEALVTKHIDRIEETIKGHLSEIAELHASLTPEQRERLVEVIEEHNDGGRLRHRNR